MKILKQQNKSSQLTFVQRQALYQYYINNSVGHIEIGKDTKFRVFGGHFEGLRADFR